MSSLRHPQRRGPAASVGDVLGDVVVGDDVAGGLEPEHRHLGQHLALVGDRGRQDDVVGRDPVGGDHDDLVAVRVHLADLSRGDQSQVVEGGAHGAMLTMAGDGSGASQGPAPEGRADGALPGAADPLLRAVARAPRRDLQRPAARAGRRRLPLRPGVDQAPLHRRPDQHDRPGAQHRPRAAAGPPLAAPAGGRRAPAPAQADAAAVPRRAHARLRGRDPRGHRAHGRGLASRHRSRSTRACRRSRWR